MGKTAHHSAAGRPVIMPKLGAGIVCALVIVSVVSPLALQRSAASKLRKVNDSLAQQAGQLTQLTVENEHLSRLADAARSAQPLSADQINELLKLRNEIDRLRGETNGIQKLRAENRRLKLGPTAPEFEAELSAQTIEAMKRVSLELPNALQKLAREHGDRNPNFSELRNYFPAFEGRRMPGLHTFNFVRDEGPRPGDALILCEESTRWQSDGKAAKKVYGFTDGTAVEVTSEDGDFAAWEKQHLN